MFKFKIIMAFRLLLTGAAALAGVGAAARYAFMLDDFVNAAIVVVITGVVVSVLAPDDQELEELKRLLDD